MTFMYNAKQRGFTLIEVVVTVAIVALLAAIALPSYTAYVLRSNRTEARTTLLEAAAWMERWRTQSGRYDMPPPAAPGVPPPLPFTQVPATGAAKYTIAPPAVTAPTFSVTATAAGSMATDVCSTIVIDQSGARTFTTGGGGTQEICWGR